MIANIPSGPLRGTIMSEHETHKHTMDVKYELEVLDKLNKKRWLVIDFCTSCTYQRARDVAYDRPPQANLEGKPMD